MDYPGTRQIEGRENSDVSVDYDIIIPQNDGNHIYAKRVIYIKPDYKQKYKEEQKKKSFWQCLCASLCCLFCCLPC